MSGDKLKLAILCGGPSLERGISLNSARSLLDHLPADRFEVFPLYVDSSKRFHAISSSQLYSNTPEDFDFKLKILNKEVDPATFLSRVDLSFPAIHGPFGEDGELQTLLEKHNIPFIGSSSESLKRIFLKHIANAELKKLGYPVLPYLVVTPGDPFPLIQERTIVKPSSGGSSVGVFSVENQREALQKAKILFRQFEDKHVLLEPFCNGKEFTIVVVQSKKHGVLALTPTEIETSYENHQIFDYRKKYLPTHQTFYHTPPRFSPKSIEKIQAQAKDLFHRLNLRDFVRMDGWYMDDGTIYFSDFNPTSGLEQNSFLFRQAAALGFTHEEILLEMIENACDRYSLPFPQKPKIRNQNKTNVFVLLGGKTAERQVSLMSGTNVWLKLLKSENFHPTPFLLDSEDTIWELSYAHALNHTVEEIQYHCFTSKSPRYPLSDFLLKAKMDNAFVFIALHGGMGENGVLQEILENANIPFNGSDSKSSLVCMDKYLTGKKIDEARDPEILSLPKKIISFHSGSVAKNLWSKTTKEWNTKRLLIKPKDDGCSAGIVVIQSQNELERYARLVQEKTPCIPPNTFSLQNRTIEMPLSQDMEFLIEPFIETDKIVMNSGELRLIAKTGWIEMTVGIIESKGLYTAFNPSITVAEEGILSLEEKFQGGTGINLTPPPESIVPSEDLTKIKQLIEKTASILNLRNYARIDIFYHRIKKQVIVIEANTLPALTPSTVLYHQALAENPPISPRELLERIILNQLQSNNTHSK